MISKKQKFPKMIIQYIKTCITPKNTNYERPANDDVLPKNTVKKYKNKRTLTIQFKIYNYDIKNRIKKVISKTGISPIRNSFGHGWTAIGIKKKP